METRSLIGGMVVASSHNFIVYGPIRGLVWEGDLPTDAFEALQDDREGCSRHHQGYSDAAVYVASPQGYWKLFLPDVQEDLR